MHTAVNRSLLLHATIVYIIYIHNLIPRSSAIGYFLLSPVVLSQTLHLDPEASEAARKFGM